MSRSRLVAIGAAALLLVAACGGSSGGGASSAGTAGDTSIAATRTPATPTSASATTPPPQTTSKAPSSPPPQTSQPAVPDLGTRDKAKKYFEDDLDLDVDWKDAPTRDGRPRYLGIVDDTSAIIELFGSAKSLDEIGYAVVFNGTSQGLNFYRALPMIRLAQKYINEEAAMFVGSELDYFNTLAAIPQRISTQQYEDKFVKVESVDLVDLVTVQISRGHEPTPSGA